MRFDEAVRYLLSLGAETLAIKLGLRNTELLLSALGDPQKSYPSVQIAGTNGKGSTAVLLNSICDAAGIKTGLYTSPHLISIRERMRFGQREISEEDFAHAATQVRRAAEAMFERRQIDALPTFFEQVTAIALAAFKQANVDLAILETGLGGRLDATSVAQAQLVAITPIALDHEEYLGKTIESIAAEKAAIIRPGVTAIIASQPPQALEVILSQAERGKVEPKVADWDATIEKVTEDGRFQVTVRTVHDQYQHLLIGLRGRHQIVNAAVAIRLAESLHGQGFDITRSAIHDGIGRASHAGRLELWPGKPSFLFDGAHNTSGVQALRDYLQEFIKAPLTLVFGAMRDKNLAEMAGKLFPIAQELVLTMPDNPRAATLELLQQAATSLVDAQRVSAAGSVKSAISRALEVTPPDGLICITGSLYLIGDAQIALHQIGEAKTAN